MSAIPCSTFDEDFQFAKILGKGNYATVSMVTHRVDKRKYALKQLITESTEELTQAFNEIEVLKALEDESITNIAFYYVRHKPKSGNFELGMVMDLCDSNLADIIRERKKKNAYYSVDEVKYFISSTLPFFAKMQRKGYVHRDIKPDNILLTKGKKVDYKVADFGFAVRLNAYSNRNIAGTMEYVSPKLLVKFKNRNISVPGHNIKDDVYSYGKTLSEMMTLEMGQPFCLKKLIQCKERYGKEVGLLLEMMIIDSEAKRADFVYLEEYLLKNNLAGTMTVSDRSTVSRSRGKNSINSGKTTPRNGGKDSNVSTATEFSTLKAVKNRRRKHIESTETTAIKFQNILQPPVDTKIEQFQPQTAIFSPSESKEKEKLNIKDWKQTHVKVKQEISCLDVCDNLLFMGMEDRLGCMVIATQKLIMLSSADSLRKITCLKVSSNEEHLYIGALNCKIYCIPLVELNKLIIKNNRSFKIQNTLEISLSCLIFREICLTHPISTFSVAEQTIHSPHTMVVGHFTGELSVISNYRLERKVVVSTEPITCLTLKYNTLYTSTVDGVFKRQNALSLGVLTDIAKEDYLNPCVTRPANNKFFKCHGAILTFEIILDCKTNRSISNPKNHYLAVLASCDGFLHLVSNSMNVERTLRVAQVDILAAHFQVDLEHRFGAQGLFVGVEGTLSNQEGEELKKMDEKNLSCLAASPKSIFCGGFVKKLLILGSTDDTIDLE